MVKAITSTVILTLACLIWSVYGLVKDTISSGFTADQIKSSTIEPAIKSGNEQGLLSQAANDRETADRQRLWSAAVPALGSAEPTKPHANVPSIALAYPTQAQIPALPPVPHPLIASRLNVNARAVKEVFAEDLLARRAANGRSAIKLAEGEEYAN